MIEVERDGPVFVLRMRAGENRFSTGFLRTLNEHLDEIEASEGPAALVSVGEGKFYSNGLDLEGLGELSATDAGAYVQSVHALFARVLRFPIPTVAAMNGHAFAGGAMLALAHDFRIMRADRGYVCLPEIDLRIPLTPGMTALLRRRLPEPTAREAILTGRRYGGDDCAAAGIVDLAVPEAEVLPRAIERATALAGKDRATLRSLKEGLYRETLAVLEDPYGSGAA